MDWLVAEHDARVVDEHVDVPVPGEDVGDDPFPVLDLGHIQPLELDRVGQGAFGRVLEVCSDDGGALLGEELGDRKTDALRRSGNQSELSLKAIHVVSPLSSVGIDAAAAAQTDATSTHSF